MGTGAPADITSRTCPSDFTCDDEVASTFANAAGDAKTIVARIALHASSRAFAVNVAGDVTSMSASPVVIPRAGPNNANGANAATKLSVSVIL